MQCTVDNFPADMSQVNYLALNFGLDLPLVLKNSRLLDSNCQSFLFLLKGCLIVQRKSCTITALVGKGIKDCR